ncbi:MAG: carboxypeptidase regulatory-like domain-containing protein [Gemmatimonadales bacterium]
MTAPDSTPVERANVTVTSLSGNVSRVARTDKSGRFTVTFPGDDGDYWINIGALGYASKRFEVKRTGDQEILVADARLTRVATQLDAVKVQADRQKASRNDLNADISGSDRAVNGAAVSADQLGDLAAMAASLPGVQLIPSADGGPAGFSVLGLSPDQNATTLNGLNYGGSNLPRDANVSTSVITTPYDVSRGNFSGGLLNVRSRPGSNYIVRSMSYNADAPQLQWTDARARALGQQYGSLSLGGLVAGPIQFDKSFYSIAYQAGRRMNNLQTLLNTGPLGLETAGIAPDSVSRLLGILQRAGVPATVGGIPENRLSDNASVFGTLDFAPPSSTSGQALNVTFSGSWSRQDPSGGATTELPAHMGERTNWFGSLQGKHSSYFGFGVLSETQLGVNHSNFYGLPFAVLPNGSVLVNSTFSDGTPSVQGVAFGGNPAMNTGQTSTTVQATNALSWFSENNKHKLKLTTELRRDMFGQDLTANELGTFSFNSLADLDAGQPASFTRQLSASRRNESQYVAGASLGETYRPTDNLQIQYGLRLDGNRFDGGPASNSAVEQQFGVRNDAVPNHLYASPRVGFSWVYGTASQVSAFDGMVRGPQAVIRGGIGIFQSTPSATSIGSAMNNTGLASAVQQLVCVGVAAPSPDWAAYAADPSSVPAECADGTAGTVFSSTSPNVVLFDRGYSAPRALRSNLQWSGVTLGNRLSTTIDGTYSLNLNQASTFDLNFNPTQQFTLDDEGNRPVYARAASIVPATGAIGAGESRVATQFSHVSELRSDMESEARQLTLQVRPYSFSSSYSWTLAYVYANTRERYRGFTSTAGNPLDETWGRSSLDSRHQIIYTLTYNAFDFIRMSWYGSFRSGLPYTPVVAGDINGDGYSNDRAYIFDPASSPDSAVASGMRSLLANGSSSARGCLLGQINHVAARNSCEGPWSSTANLTFSFNPVKVRLPQRATLSFQLANPLGAVDALIHGPSNLHGWGQTFLPQSQLLFVRGFDQATDRYTYEVNQRFGATALSQTATRLPVTLTTMLRVDVGPTRERQGLTQMLDRGRTTPGQKVPEQMYKAFYGSGGVINPMATLLRQADTLELTEKQADSIAILNRSYTIRLDSIWTPTSKYFAALPKNYDEGEAYDRYRTAREASVDALIRIAPAIRSLLTPAQMRRLPSFVTPYLDTRYLASVRSGTAGTGLGMIMLPGGMAIPGGAGGGVRIEISKP